MAAGPVYAADVFAKPSVARKELGLEVTLRTPAGQPAAGELICEARQRQDRRRSRWTAPPQTFSIAAGKEQVLDFAAEWENPKLWWPDEPNCYRLRTTVKLAGKPVDVRETLFGFREWTWRGPRPEAQRRPLAGLLGAGQPGARRPRRGLRPLKSPKLQLRLRPHVAQHGGQFKWLGKEPGSPATTWTATGPLSAARATSTARPCGYMPAQLAEAGPQLATTICPAWIKGHRNHPSIFLWSVENELNFINARNLGQLDVWEPILAQAWEVAAEGRPHAADHDRRRRRHPRPDAADPRRPLLDQAVLELSATGLRGQRHLPRLDLGREAAEVHRRGAVSPRASTRPTPISAASRSSRERPATGPRWARPCRSSPRAIAGSASPGATSASRRPTPTARSTTAGRPRAVFVRQWDYTFASGQKATRTFGIFNNTRFADPLAFTWKLTARRQARSPRKTTEHKVPPGESEKFDVEIAHARGHAPREEGELLLTLVGRRARRCSARSKRSPCCRRRRSEGRRSRPGDLVVYDPKGKVSPLLEGLGIPFTAQESLAPPAAAGKIWLIGPDALTPAEAPRRPSPPTRWAAGGSLILEQENPLRVPGPQPGRDRVAAKRRPHRRSARTSAIRSCAD